METSLRCLRPYQLQVTYGICERPHGLAWTLWPLPRIEISGTFSNLIRAARLRRRKYLVFAIAGPAFIPPVGVLHCSKKLVLPCS